MSIDDKNQYIFNGYINLFISIDDANSHICKISTFYHNEYKNLTFNVQVYKFL